MSKIFNSKRPTFSMRVQWLVIRSNSEFYLHLPLASMLTEQWQKWNEEGRSVLLQGVTMQTYYSVPVFKLMNYTWPVLRMFLTSVRNFLGVEMTRKKKQRTSFADHVTVGNDSPPGTQCFSASSNPIQPKGALYLCIDTQNDSFSKSFLMLTFCRALWLWIEKVESFRQTLFQNIEY